MRPCRLVVHIRIFPFHENLIDAAFFIACAAIYVDRSTIYLRHSANYIRSQAIYVAWLRIHSGSPLAIDCRTASSSASRSRISAG